MQLVQHQGGRYWARGGENPGFHKTMLLDATPIVFLPLCICTFKSLLNMYTHVLTWIRRVFHLSAKYGGASGAPVLELVEALRRAAGSSSAGASTLSEACSCCEIVLLYCTTVRRSCPAYMQLKTLGMNALSRIPSICLMASAIASSLLSQTRL